jgi:hypothetical protein
VAGLQIPRRIPHEQVASALAREVTSIDYSNFKAAVGLVDKRRAPFYGWVWNVMGDMQDELEASACPYRKPG